MSMSMMMGGLFVSPEDFTINFGSQASPLSDNNTRISDNLQYDTTGKTNMNFGLGSSLDDILIMIPYDQNVISSTGTVDGKTFYQYEIPSQSFFFYPTFGASELGPVGFPELTLKKIIEGAHTALWYSTSINALNLKTASYFTGEGFTLYPFSSGISISEIISKGGFVDGSNILRAKFFFLSCGNGHATVTSITTS